MQFDEEIWIKVRENLASMKREVYQQIRKADKTVEELEKKTRQKRHVMKKTRRPM